MKKQILNEKFRRMQILAGIITESQMSEYDDTIDENTTLSPEEKKIVDDILETLNEGVFDKNKFKSYLKKGLISVAIIATILGSTQLDFNQKKEVVDAVKTEQAVDPSIEDVANARYAISYYQTFKDQVEKNAQGDAQLQFVVKEINRMINDKKTNDSEILKSFGKNYKTQIEKLTKIK
jgi:hypothetical protein